MELFIWNASQKKQEELNKNISQWIAWGSGYWMYPEDNLEHFRKAGDNDEVGEVLKRLEIAYNSNKKSLVYSVIAFIMRACGLSAGLPHLDFNNLNASITSIFELIE